MRNLMTATSIAALLVAGSLGSSHAQSETGAQQTEQSASANGSTERDAREITCREITAMDEATVPGILYFISGYSAGQGEQSMTDRTASAGSTSASGANGTTAGDLPETGAAAASGTQDTTASANTPGMDDSTASDVSGTEDSTASASVSGMNDSTASSSVSGTDSTAAADVSGTDDSTASAGVSATDDSTTASTTGSTDATGAPGDNAANARIAVVRGYFDIPVEKTLVACGQTPDSRASDVIEQQKSSSQ